jgi:hypothetical protein
VRGSLFLGLIFLATLLSARAADACPCGNTPQEDAERADDVFRGKLVAMRAAWPTVMPERVWNALPTTVRPEFHCRADLEVTEVIQGDRSPTRSVYYEASYGDCGEGTTIGDQYLVFAVKRDGASWFLPTCGASGRAADRAPILAALGPGVPPDPAPPTSRWYAALGGVAALLALMLAGVLVWWRRVSSASS